MDNQQKGTILTLLKVDEINRNYTNKYWFSYKDFLDPTDDFTDFSQPVFLIGDNGELILGTKLFSNNYFIYYCWWD